MEPFQPLAYDPSREWLKFLRIENWGVVGICMNAYNGADTSLIKYHRTCRWLQMKRQTWLKGIVNIYQLSCLLLKSSHVVQSVNERGHEL